MKFKALRGGYRHPGWSMGGKWIADGPCLPMKTGSANGGTDSHQAWKTDFSE